MRRVCVFTGSRADYSPLYPFIRRLYKDSDVDLRILVSGGHLVPDQGSTARAIEADGFTVDEAVEIVLSSDTSTGVSKSFGLACIGYADSLERISPDVLILLGDRYEAFAAAVVALQKLIPVVHVGGGQLSYGSTDDQMRHAISKLSDFHFVVAPGDRRRLIQMGEDPGRIFEVGMIGLDPLLLAELLTQSDLEQELDIRLESPTFLITYHPSTARSDLSGKSVEELLIALDAWPQATLIFTASNVDNGSGDISKAIRSYVQQRKGRTRFVSSLGSRRYLSLMKHADLVVGNSSSGINEAPVLGTRTVNIGSRQDGRFKLSSVLDCGESHEEIDAAINEALYDVKATPTAAAGIESVAASLEKMVDIVKKISLRGVKYKRFYDTEADGTT